MINDLLSSDIMKLLDIIKSKLKGRYWYARLTSFCHAVVVRINPRYEGNRCYRKFFGHNVNWENPQDLIEKIMWMSLYSDTSEWTRCADKYKVREYVKECGLENSLVELYGKWDDADDIDFDKLPDRFVLKSNHACATVLLVQDKHNLDVQATRKLLKNWLNLKYGYGSVQLHYTRIKPCIIAEELLTIDDVQRKVSPMSLIDYKFYCCDGEPECVWVAMNRSSRCLDFNLYDMNWNQLREYIVSNEHYVFRDIAVPKPKSFDQMKEMCRKLAAPFPQVRVDLYEVNGKPYFGELTFTSGWSVFTPEFYKYLGSKITLPVDKA